MSRIKQVCGVVAVLVSFAVPAAGQAQSPPVKATVTFTPKISDAQRVAAVESAGGRVVRVRPKTVVARMSSSAADGLRAAMGVVSVRISR